MACMIVCSQGGGDEQGDGHNLTLKEEKHTNRHMHTLKEVHTKRSTHLKKYTLKKVHTNRKYTLKKVQHRDKH